MSRGPVGLFVVVVVVAGCPGGAGDVGGEGEEGEGEFGQGEGEGEEGEGDVVDDRCFLPGLIGTDQQLFCPSGQWVSDGTQVIGGTLRLGGGNTVFFTGGGLIVEDGALVLHDDTVASTIALRGDGGGAWDGVRFIGPGARGDLQHVTVADVVGDGAIVVDRVGEVAIALFDVEVEGDVPGFFVTRSPRPFLFFFPDSYRGADPVVDVASFGAFAGSPMRPRLREGGVVSPAGALDGVHVVVEHGDVVLSGDHVWRDVDLEFGDGGLVVGDGVAGALDVDGGVIHGVGFHGVFVGADVGDSVFAHLAVDDSDGYGVVLDGTGRHVSFDDVSFDNDADGGLFVDCDSAPVVEGVVADDVEHAPCP